MICWVTLDRWLPLWASVSSSLKQKDLPEPSVLWLTGPQHLGHPSLLHVAFVATSQVGMGPSVVVAEPRIWPRLSSWGLWALRLWGPGAGLGQVPAVDRSRGLRLGRWGTQIQGLLGLLQSPHMPASSLSARSSTLTVQPEGGMARGSPLSCSKGEESQYPDLCSSGIAKYRHSRGVILGSQEAGVPRSCEPPPRRFSQAA